MGYLPPFYLRYIITARRLVLPGDLQGRSRHVDLDLDDDDDDDDDNDGDEDEHVESQSRNSDLLSF